MIMVSLKVYQMVCMAFLDLDPARTLWGSCGCSVYETSIIINDIV